MTFSMNGYEEWKEKNRNEKAEISKMDLIEACGRVAAAAAMPKDAGVGVVAASREIAKIIREYFPKKKEEEPDAEKPAEKTELSALEELLFERTHLAEVKCKEVCSDIRYGSVLESHGLIRDAGLQEKYDAWKEEKGYE